jgi:hypothetical protein
VNDVYPFRLKLGRDGSVAAFPAECEVQCVLSDELRDHLGYGRYAEYLEYMSRTRDERQCRGCGRWGIFERRALPAATPCLCCTGKGDDCKCRVDCGSTWCQMAGERFGPVTAAWIARPRVGWPSTYDYSATLIDPEGWRRLV